MSKFKENDIIVCVDIVSDLLYDRLINLTYGKEYVVYDDSTMNFSIGFEVVHITDDRGIIWNYRASRFMCVREYRSNTINNILDL